LSFSFFLFVDVHFLGNGFARQSQAANVATLHLIETKMQKGREANSFTTKNADGETRTTQNKRGEKKKNKKRKLG
jgi:hypothetical protein